METPSINIALTIDVVTFIAAVLVARAVTSTLLHPAAIQLGAHFYIVTLRLVQMRLGFSPMHHYFAWPVDLNEVIRAGLASDLALAATALAWVAVRKYKRKRKRAVQAVQNQATLSPSRTVTTAIVSITLGLLGLAALGPSGLQSAKNVHGTDGYSGYLWATSSFPAWGLCLLHYIFGFPVPLVIVTLVSFVALMFFNVSRAAVILPAIFLVLTWLTRKKKKGIPIGVVASAVAIWLAWLPMKPIFYSLQEGAPINEALDAGVETAFRNFGSEGGNAIDFEFLDMVASTMTLVDLNGKLFWGTTVAPLLSSPIPRAIWPDKPQLNQYQLELDIPSRNMGELTMTAGLVGEAYANFRWVGIFMVPFLVSLAYAVAWERVRHDNALTPRRLLYVLYLAVYLQIYRDGLVSVVWFPFVHCAPVAWAVFSNKFGRRRRTPRRLPSPRLTTHPPSPYPAP